MFKKLSFYFWCWLGSFLVMVSLSYFWHGIALNDLNKLTIPLHLFWILFTVAYASIAAINVFLVERIKNKQKTYVKSLILGTFLGFFIELIAVVFGLSFVPNINASFLTMDFLWQMIEQGIGGFVAGAIYSLCFKIEMVNKHFQ